MGVYTLEELSAFTNSELVGDPTKQISHVNSLGSAREEDASFLANPRYQEKMKQSKAGVICIDPHTSIIAGKNFLICKNPSHTFQLIAEKILSFNDLDTGFQGIHPTAVIHDSATIGKGVTIGPHVVIGRDTVIGDDTKILALVFIGAEVKIGENCLIYPGAIVRERSILGDHVILQPGAIIGSCGYGYTTDPSTGQHDKLGQLGNVEIEDKSEVGANSTIDRARFQTTLVKKGTKIDNLVQVAHNVELGENNLLVSQSGIAGSTKFGDNVFLGAQSGITGHLTITDKVQIAARGGVSKSITQSGIYGGSPVSPIATSNKRQVHLRKIEKYVKEIKALKTRVEALEKAKEEEELSPGYGKTQQEK